MRPASLRFPTRRALPSIVAGTALVAALTSSCSGGGSTSGTPSSNPSDGAAAAAVVTDYFVNGIGGGDWAKASALSTGPLKDAADWLVTQGISTSEQQRGTFTINSMAVASMTGTKATFDLNATQTGANYTTTYTGPVTVVRDTSGWNVTDYLRDGRDAAAAIFPNATGQASRSGVTVKVVGAQLESNHVDVWAEITNATSSSLAWDLPIVIVDASGRQLGHGFLFVSSADTTEPFEMLPRVSAFGDFLVDNVTVPLTTRNFHLLVGATDRASKARIDLNVPVTLR